MEARDYAVRFALNARAVSFDDVRAGSDKQVFYTGPLYGSRDRIFENRHESLFCLLFMLANIVMLANSASIISHANTIRVFRALGATRPMGPISEHP